MDDEGCVALYFLEPGESPLPGKVTYDREYTPFRNILPEEFDWDTLLDTRLVFLTGITAALTPETARVVRYFADAARDRGVDVCRALREEIGAPTVVSTDGRAGTYLSTAAGGESVYEIKSVPVIDRPGAGDSFVAGTLHGWLDGDVGRGIEMGTKVAQLALTHHGDLTHVRPGDLLALQGSDIVR